MHVVGGGQAGRPCLFGQLPHCTVSVTSLHRVLAGAGAVPVEWRLAGLDARDVLFELLVVAAHLFDGLGATHVACHVVPPVGGVRVVHRQGTLEQLVLRPRPLRLRRRRTLVVGGHGGGLQTRAIEHRAPGGLSSEVRA
jgi:hypothetical protein